MIMHKRNINRRQFSQWLSASLLLGATGLKAKVQPSVTRLHVAAIQMEPKLGHVSYNLEQAERLIIEAKNKGATWIVLPEMFTTAMAFHEDILSGIELFDGPALKMMKRLAAQGNVVIGGSFLAQRREGVFNTFALVFPDGKVVKHDKDLPTYWENCYYQSGSDDGVLDTPIGNVGSILCWEYLRSQTARRLLNKVDFIMGGSCWWTVPDDVEDDSPYRSINIKMAHESVPNMAKMLGVPIVNGSHVGHFEAFFSPELLDVDYHSIFLGETMIVDAKGNVLVSRAPNEGAGVITATIEINKNIKPSMPISDNFWIPEGMPIEWKESWLRWFDAGADYYKTVTSPYLKTGEIEEYEPPYMR